MADPVQERSNLRKTRFNLTTIGEHANNSNPRKGRVTHADRTLNKELLSYTNKFHESGRHQRRPTNNETNSATCTDDAPEPNCCGRRAAIRDVTYRGYCPNDRPQNQARALAHKN